MKFLIFDANNIANLSFYRAKSTLMADVDKAMEDENNTKTHEELMAEVYDGITGFATHMFFNKVHSIMKLNKKYRMIFIWDGRYGSVWRKEENPEYKANRKHDGDSTYPIFIDMMNKCREILNSYPVVQFGKEDAEADDLIYSFCEINTGAEDIKVVSTDTDMVQLPQKFHNVNIWNPIKKKFHEIPEYDYVLFKSVVGDKSDNITGIPKYGKVKGERIARKEMEIPTEYASLIVDNLLIIDMAKNPHIRENNAYILENEDFLKIEQLEYDFKTIQDSFFELKLKNQIEKFETTKKLISSLV